MRQRPQSQLWRKETSCKEEAILYRFQTAYDDLEYQPDAVADGWYFLTTMTNPYPLPAPEPDDEDAEAMMRPPTSHPASYIEPQPPPAQPTEPQPAKPRRRLTNLFWPGFATAFLLLTIASCGGVVLATGINRIDLQSTGQVWTPPVVTATPVVTPAPAEESTTIGEAGGAFTMGQQLFNITASQVNIRAVPGYLSKPNGDVIGQVPPGARVEVIGGRSFADGLTWWLIRYTAPDGATIDGWIAEATASGVQILGQ